MIINIKKIPLIAIITIGGLLATESSFQPPTANQELAPFKSLSLSPAPKTQATRPVVVTIDDIYRPGQTVTVNLQVIEQRQETTAASAIIFGETVKMQEFTPGTWLAFYKIPATTTPGKYPLKVYVKQQATAEKTGTILEQLVLNVENPLSAITVKNNHFVSDNAILSLVTLAPGEFHHPIRAEISRQRILDLGFFESVQSLHVTANQENLLTFVVKENPVINKIEIIGAVEFSQRELKKTFGLKEGEILNNRQLQRDLIALEKFYQDNEYNFFKITALERPAAENNYTLTLWVSEGRLRNINIAGNNVTKEYVLTREMELREGNIFQGSKLREDLRRIYNLNYFAQVIPEVSVDRDSDLIDVTINVEEKKTSSINFGGGYGQIQGWFGFTDLFLDNIAGTAQSTLFKAQFGQRQTSYQFQYHNPWMWDNKTSFTAKLWSTRGFNYISGQQELRNGWSGTVGLQKSQHVRESYTFRYEDVFNLADSNNNYRDRAVAYSIAYDSRDQWMNPRKGSYDVFTMDHSTSILGSSINASRYSIQANRFHPLTPKQILAGRFMYNYQIGDIFPTEQYYVGSDNTVRGYRSVFARGNERFIFNLEYRYIFTEMFVGALFYDIGRANLPVIDSDYRFTNYQGWGSGMGFGVRIITPMGPIRLDYAWNKNQEFSDGFLFFNMGHSF